MAKKKLTNKKQTTDSADLNRLRGRLGDDLSIPEMTEMFVDLNQMGEADMPPEHEEAHSELRIDCLKKSLQKAVKLEFATIPPYLCALWSIKEEEQYQGKHQEKHPVAESIREVVQEEMLHMALACNMLASIGGKPEINTEPAVPLYPTPLPGGVHEGLKVGLQPLGDDSLVTFLWIERPPAQVPVSNPYNKETEKNLAELNDLIPPTETIGSFYHQILETFKAYVEDGGGFTTENQVSGPLSKAVVRSMETVEYAIKLITDQGEGSENNPEETKGDLSHYYRFLEVYLGEKYKWNEKTKVLEYDGELPRPEVLDMAPIPEGGYHLGENVSEEVWYHLDQFDNVYSELLDQLQQAWTMEPDPIDADEEDGHPPVAGQASLICAYGTMFDLEEHAKWLMKTEIPDGSGKTFGPCFRYKPKSKRDKTSKAPKAPGKCPI